MDFIINYWYLIVAAIAVIAAGVYVAVKFFRLPSDKQLTKVREWLLFAVTEAEKAFGSGTGKLKLRFVYDMFVGKFTWIAKVITFDQFSYLVDDALDEMREMLATNTAVAQLVNNETTTDKE